MNFSLYNPFKKLEFNANTCFLTGKETTESITVFPEWLMKRFNFDQDAFEMMDKVNKLLYADLKMPCSEDAKLAIEEMDAKVKTAFDAGYESMKKLDDVLLFQWIGRIVYGVLYHELSIERERMDKYQKPFELSPFLKERYAYFHCMLQSLVIPMSFSELKPWSISVFQLKYSADIFSYRDDAVNLMFQLGINGFGFVAALQDNGAIGEKQAEILEKIEGHVLHPIQFEELYGRFHYSEYIFQYKPSYHITETENGIHIEALPIEIDASRPLFGHWDDDMFAQVLANYWQVYGIQKNDILQFQKPPISYLENPYSKNFIKPESIKLPF